MIELIKTAIDFVLHIDQYISMMIEHFGAWTNVIIFTIIFCETGLVVTPFLPGDSFLFAIGAFAAKGDFNIFLVTPMVVGAALLGDNVNYLIGKTIGPRVFSSEKIKFLNKKYLEKTHQFYEKHGGKTIIIARFVPIVRTFAPFVAGVGAMTYRRFIVYSIIGAVSWSFLFIPLGYFFGNLPFVKKNFTLVIFAIIILSIMPGIIEYLRIRMGNNQETDNKQ